MKKLVGAIALTLLACACNPQQAVPPANPERSVAAEPAPAYRVVNWGQRSTPAGVPFNVQADGNSGISFELSHPAPAGEITASFDGKPLTGVVASGVIVTATIPGEYLATAGAFPVALQIRSLATTIPVGTFEVN